MEEMFDDNLENELLQASDNETGQQQEEDGDGNDNNIAKDGNEADASQKEAVKKRIVIRKPQPKLDPDRLCGQRGIPILPDLFDKVKFKGKKHEKEDLDTLMSELEHWAHRLFPKLPFNAVLERVEKLGSKKPVQVCIKKMRLDLPILNEDFVSRGSDDEKDGDNEASLPNHQSQSDPFEELLRQERDSTRMSQLMDSSINEDRDCAANTSTLSVLSEEVQQRIEKNKQLAAERRKKAQERNLLIQNQSLNLSEMYNSVAEPNLETNCSQIKETLASQETQEPTILKTVESVPSAKIIEEMMDLNSDDDAMLATIDMQCLEKVQ